MSNEQTITTATPGMPSQTAVTNPPAVTEQSEADRARAALGGSPMENLPDIEEEAAPPPPRPHVRGKNAPPPARFKPPSDLEFEFTHPERVELHNSNLPLTLGLLGSIMGSFVVFFVS